MNVLEENTPLFSKSLLVLFKENGQRKTTLDVSIQSRISSIRHRKELFIQLTNPDDLFFLQTLTLGEEDFQNLKSQQGLLVDFIAFGQKFIDLLEMCINEEKALAPRFILQFTCSLGSMTSSSCLGTLEVVETNPFKHLVHLSLKFVAGNDEEVKKYLVTCLKSLKEEKSSLENHLNGTEKDLSSRLSNAQKLLSDQSKELSELKEKLHREVDETTKYYQGEITKEKEAFLKLQQTCEEKICSNRINLEEQFNKQIHELERKWRELQSANKDLTDHKYRYESLIRELKSKLSTLEQERSVITRDVQTLRRQNTNLDSDRHERDKTLNHLRTRVAVLEQELQDKEHVIQRANELIETSNDQKARLEMDLNHHIRQSNQSDENVKTLSAEVIKGNEIIQKLQGDMKNLKGRVKMLNIVTTKQERIIEEKAAVLLQKESNETKHKEDNMLVKKQLEEEKAKYEDISLKLNESEETLKNNENVINWLNKQLNEQSIHRLSSTHNLTSNTTNGRIPSNTTGGRIPYIQNQQMNIGSSNMNPTPRYPINNSYLPPNTTQPSINHQPPRYNQSQHLVNQQPVQYRPPNQPPNRPSNQPNIGHHMATDSYAPRNKQVHYRPILKKPQFKPDGISPIVPMTTKQPLRQKQLHISTPAYSEEPVLDPKYLMRKKPLNDDMNKQNENVDPDAVNMQQGDKITRTVKPFPLSTANFVK